MCVLEEVLFLSKQKEKEEVPTTTNLNGYLSEITQITNKKERDIIYNFK
jgi:hypothetical protein